MKNKNYIAICLMGFLAACQSEEMTVPVNDGSKIYLTASVEGRTNSRTPYNQTAPTKDKPLKVDVWASTTYYEFINGSQNGTGTDAKVSLHTTATFTDGEEQLLDATVYPKKPADETQDGTVPVYFVGLHPQGWTGTDNGKSASYTFNGSQDVMFAPQIFGKYAANLTAATWPTFTFKHLLTWLRIQVVAENEDISKAWGKVKKLTVKSPNGLMVNLANHDGAYVPTENPKTAFDKTKDISFAEEKVDLPFYLKDNNMAFDYSNDNEGGVLLRAPFNEKDNIEHFIDEVAYTLCAPVKATINDEEDTNLKTNEYTLTVTTENRTVSVNVDLMNSDNVHFSGSTMGCQFTILLKFKLGNTISATATVTDWSFGGMGIGDIVETD